MAPPVFADSIGRPHNTPGALTFQQYLKQGRQDKVSHAPVHPKFGPAPDSPPPDGRPVALPSSTEAPTMKPLTVTLSPTFLSNGPGAKTVDLTSSDGRLEVQLAPGTFDLSYATVASSTTTGNKKTTRSAHPRQTAQTTPTVTPPPGVPGKATPTAHVTPMVTPSVTTTSATPTAPATPATPGTSSTPTTVTGALTLTLTEQHGYFVGENVSLGISQKAWYAHDAGGERTIQRTTNGTTSMTVYAFGSEEYQYDGSGTLQSSTHYYDLGGRLIGELTGNGTPTTSQFLTDELGSVLATFSNTQGSAAVQGNQTYGPYGSQQYQQGSMNTAKGYTGQYVDPLTGFDYYNARYYDPVAGVFLSADSVQGNASGANPYAYVGGNPETSTDPTGEMMCSATCGGGGGSGGNGNPTPPPAPAPSCDWWCGLQNTWHNVTQTYQTAWNNAAHGYESIWQHDQSYTQQAQETIARTVSQGISAAHIIIGVVIAAAIGIGVGAYLWWQHTHQARPDWANLIDNEGVPHQRSTPGGRIVNSSQHVLSQHVYLDTNALARRALRIRNNATAFYDEETAQITVDYALQNMTSAQKKQLQAMRDNPMSGKQLVLTGTMNADIGHGFRYDSATGSVTYVAATRTYEIRIAVDVKTGVPYIITAYPTLP